MSKIFGERLKKLRKLNDLYQKELAECLSVDSSTIGYWERGIKEPDSETFIKIADYFDVTLDYLLGRETEKNNNSNFTKKEKLKKKII